MRILGITLLLASCLALAQAGCARSRCDCRCLPHPCSCVCGTAAAPEGGSQTGQDPFVPEAETEEPGAIESQPGEPPSHAESAVE